MPIDPRIALGFQGVDVGQILQNAQQMQQRRMEMENQKYLMDRRRTDDARSDDYRAALGDVLTNGAGFTQQPGGPTAEQRAVQADPEGYLSFQGKQTNIKAGQLKQANDLNNAAMQILGGVHDDASLQAAKRQAHALYQQFGEDSSFIDQLPDTYSPEMVRDLQMRGMDTAHQLQAVARENQLDLNAENIEADNERADKALSNLSSYREQRIQQMREAAQTRDATARRGQDMSSTDRQAAIKQRADAAKMRGAGKSAAVSAGDGAIIRNPKTGQRMKLQNGQWVPIP